MSGGGGAANKTFQFKLVLLGEGAVGKSSLVLRFVRGQFFDYQVPHVAHQWRCQSRNEYCSQHGQILGFAKSMCVDTTHMKRTMIT